MATYELDIFSGSESPAAFAEKNPLSTAIKEEGARQRQMLAKLLVDGDKKGGVGDSSAEGDASSGGDAAADGTTAMHLSNEISAPYEVPQYPIEQIETKLIR